MEEYRSPFLLPDQKKLKCTNPGDARLYPDAHADAGRPGRSHVLWGGACPVHSTWNRPSAAYREWYRCREGYAAAENDRQREYYLQEMLCYVTPDNPPDAPAGKHLTTVQRARRTATETPASVVVATLTGAAITVWIAVILGLALGLW